MIRAPASSGFRLDEAFDLVERTLLHPPARPHIVRPALRGERVARFYLPLDLCKPQNRTRHGKAWQLGKMKSDLLFAMLSQHGRRSAPLPGRPQVICLRLSSNEPDAYCDWAKAAVDRLTVNNSGLGFLRDDRPSDAEIIQYWEPAPPKKGCVMIEVRA